MVDGGLPRARFACEVPRSELGRQTNTARQQHSGKGVIGCKCGFCHIKMGIKPHDNIRGETVRRGMEVLSAEQWRVVKFGSGRASLGVSSAWMGAQVSSKEGRAHTCHLISLS